MKQVVLDFLLALTALPLAAYSCIRNLAQETSSKITPVSLAVIVWMCAMAYCAVLRLYLEKQEDAKPEETLESAPEKQIVIGQKICAVMMIVNALSVALVILRIYGIF